VPSIAVGTERMKLVITTEKECPARLVARPGPTASVATEAAFLVVGPRTRGRTVQAREHLL
jgi:hypothetical protein